MSDWIILRCAGRSTLALADSLNRAGIEAWSPRAPSDGPNKTAIVPMTPTYVFAQAAHVLDLIRLSADLATPHPGFSVMHKAQGIPVVRDVSLAGLRRSEAKAQPKEQPRYRARHAKRFDVGEGVRVGNVKGFEGMDGVVERSDERKTLIAFGGWLTLEIETWILRPDDVGSAEPKLGRAA